MNHDIETRMWEAIAKRKEREALAKWIMLVVAVTMLVVMTLVAKSRGSELPQAPHMAMHQPIETYSPDERMIVHNTLSRRIVDAPGGRLVDWSFILGHGIYAGATAFDYYETARNVGTCAAEGNVDLGSHPSNQRLAIHGAVEFGAVTGGDLLLKWAMRHNQVPGWLERPIGVLGAAIGTGKHVQGGMQWVRLCK